MLRTCLRTITPPQSLLRSRIQTLHHNRMSTTTTSTSTSPKKKMEWLVLLPDHSGAIQKRLEVRPQHLAAITPLHRSNVCLWGGAFFSSVPTEGETPDFAGSAMLMYAETEEEVWELIRGDVYAKSGVWDLDKVKVWPFTSAIRSDISASQG